MKIDVLFKHSDTCFLSQADGQCITGWKAAHLGLFHREQGRTAWDMSQLI